MPSSESSWLIGENLRDVPLNSAQCLEARRIKSRTTFSTTKMDPRSRTQGLTSDMRMQDQCIARGDPGATAIGSTGKRVVVVGVVVHPWKK
jgi:hypothetical protein